MPTVFDILEMDFDPEIFMGKSVLPFIIGQASDNRAAVSEFVAERRGPERKSIRLGGYKLILTPKTGRVELYDTIADPYETFDLSKREPERCDALLGRLSAELERSKLYSVGEPQFVVLDEEAKKSLKALGYID